jgi:hypothetical protein
MAIMGETGRSLVMANKRHINYLSRMAWQSVSRVLRKQVVAAAGGDAIVRRIGPAAIEIH